MATMRTIDTSWSPLRMISSAKRPYLVIVRTGEQSIHKRWPKDLISQDRNWDLLISHYGKNEPGCPDAEVIIRQGGFKYCACFRLFQDMTWLDQYRAVCFCDDDIMTSWSTLNRVFEIFDQYELALAQPSELAPENWTGS